MADHYRQQKDSKPKPAYRITSSLTSYYLLIMFSFFPIFLSNQYANARHDKYYLFLGLSLVFSVTAIALYLTDRSDDSRFGEKKKFFPPMSATDIAFLCFFGFACISTILSPYAAECLNADEARNNGLILLLCYTLVYFIITRMYVYKDYVIAVYLIFSGIVALLTVLNFFYIDPLAIFEGYGEDVIRDFGSTIGNKNTIAAYISLFLPVSMMTLVLSDSRTMRIIGGVTLVFASMGALSANSSSVILGLSVAIPAMGIFSARKYDTMRRYFLGLTILFASMKLLRLFSLIMGEHSKGFEFIQNFFIFSSFSTIAAFICGVFWLMMLLGGKKLEPHYPRRTLTVLFTVITVAVPLAAIGGVLYYTLIDTSTDLGSFDKLLRFDDRWGTHRGFMWIRSVEEYGEMNVIQKLFGAGPDMAVKVLENHFAELSARFGDSYTDTVHNEYLNYLITQGALGLLSYLTILGSVSVRAIRRAKENPLPLVLISAVLCYAVQAAVNLYTPIVTPIFFLFIAMSEGMNRKVSLTS